MGMPIVQTLLVFAQRNHIWVTAEGIETREQAAQLEKLGCNLFTGLPDQQAAPGRQVRGICCRLGAKKISLHSLRQEDDDCRNHMKQLKEEYEEFSNCLNII